MNGIIVYTTLVNKCFMGKSFINSRGDHGIRAITSRDRRSRDVMALMTWSPREFMQLFPINHELRCCIYFIPWKWIFTYEPKKCFHDQVVAKQMIGGYYEIGGVYQVSEFYGTHKPRRYEKSCWIYFFMNKMLKSKYGIWMV